MLLKRLSNARSINHIFLDLVILRDEFRHQFQDIIEQVARDSNDAFERVTENNIALFFISVISKWEPDKRSRVDLGDYADKGVNLQERQ